MSRQLQNHVRRLLGECGVHVGGDAPTDIHVTNEGLYGRVLRQGSIGLGESYMDGWWDTADLDGFLYRLLTARLDERVRGLSHAATYCRAALFNLQRQSRAFQVGQRHYDLGNDLYRAMLDPRMVYSCGYWEYANSLADAQEGKLELVFEKLRLRGGERILDVGCGWGGALKFAAERYGACGTGVTISPPQAEYARASCRGLPVEIRVQDYREPLGTFDHIYSIGMFEHVGSKNYRRFMECMRASISRKGRFLLHSIGAPSSRNHTDPWIEKYIFPNSMIPSASQITQAIERLFTIDGWQRIGDHYVPTLLAWRANFERAWPTLRAKYDERFYRMWRFYLSASAAMFRAHRLDVWQALLSPVTR